MEILPPVGAGMQEFQGKKLVALVGTPWHKIDRASK